MSSATTAFGHATRHDRGSVPSVTPPLGSMTTIGFTSPSLLVRWKVAVGRSPGALEEFIVMS